MARSDELKTSSAHAGESESSDTTQTQVSQLAGAAAADRTSSPSTLMEISTSAALNCVETNDMPSRPSAPGPTPFERGGPQRRSQLSEFVRLCERRTGERFADHRSFHDFSVAQRDVFWALFLEWTGLCWEGETAPVCTSDDCESAEFFPSVRLSYAENLLRARSAVDDACGAISAHSPYGEPSRLTRGELRARVRSLALHLARLGIGAGDQVVAVAGNNAETVIAALATAALGAVFASAAPDMGVDALLSRFAQLQPKLMFASLLSNTTAGLRHLDEHVAAVARGLPSVRALIALDDGPEPELQDVALSRLADVVNESASDAADDWPRFGFNHPLFVLFTSGTTGRPKCLVHGAGGTLVEHVKEHRLHVDLRVGEKLFFHTTAAWMMWNWQLSALAAGAELVLYDGPVSRPDTLWELARREGVDVFGTSPPYLQMCQDAGYVPPAMPQLRTILSTGSILHDWQFDWVAEHLGPVPVQSISGGTDIIGCFVLGNPDLPLRRGLIQGRSLGMDVQALLDDRVEADTPSGARIGELICRNPFPSRPLGIFGDAGERFHAAYFADNPGVWTHGDLIEFLDDGQARMHGRSDGVLNVRGSRIGPAEIYRALHGMNEVVESMAVELSRADGEAAIALLVVLDPSTTLDHQLMQTIRREIATHASPLHVPTLIAQVDELPVTHSGKRSERAVRDAINNRPIENPGALTNPASLDLIKLAVAAADDQQRDFVATAGGSSEDPTEARVLAIWEAILEVPVAPDDNFFELGGSSLMAVRLLQFVHERIGVDLPPAVFIYAQTPAQMAALIDGPPAARAPMLVPMRPGVGQPLFVLHAMGGDVLHVRPLVLALRTDRPVYGIQAVGVDPRFEPEKTIEEMASTYLPLVRSVQPGGPYALSGYSMGGLVAFEIARRLRSAGEKVELLALLDSNLSPACLPWAQRWGFAFSGPWRYATYVLGAPRERALELCRNARRRFDALRRGPASPGEPETTPRVAALEQIGLRAYRRYCPQPYDGHATLFLATTRYPGYCNPASAWRRYISHLQVEPIAADHSSVIAEATVAPLAERLSASLPR
jgi:acetoacetyl-CoA synthetase